MKYHLSYPDIGGQLKLPTVVTRKGQITIPAPIREVLAMKEGDRIEVALKGEVVTLTPVTSTLAEGYQSLPALSSPLSFKETRWIAQEDHAEEVMKS